MTSSFSRLEMMPLELYALDNVARSGMVLIRPEKQEGPSDRGPLLLWCLAALACLLAGQVLT